jgi:hypothetical protein
LETLAVVYTYDGILTTNKKECNDLCYKVKEHSKQYAKRMADTGHMLYCSVSMKYIEQVNSWRQKTP